MIVADVAENPVCYTIKPPPVVGFVRSSQCTTQPFVAVGNPMTPLEAVPPVPTLIVKAEVPLLVVIEGLAPNPDEIVGAVEDTRRFGTEIEDALSAATLVVPMADRSTVDAPELPLWVTVSAVAPLVPELTTFWKI